MTFVNPIGSWAKPARIDQGVDYLGAGPLYAIDDGIITNVVSSGWPGGHYIILKMDNAVAGAQNFYYAENITPAVTVGQRVKAGQLIGHANGSYPYVELGFSDPSDTRDNTMAHATGQSQRGIAAGDPGKYSTGWGVAASNFIKSLGGVGGVISPGGISGAVPNIGNVGTPGQQQSGGTTQTTSATGIGVGGLLGIPTEITTFFDSADKFVTALMWLTKPNNWIRIVAFLAGVILIMVAIRGFIFAAQGDSPLSMPSVTPVPV